MPEPSGTYCGLLLIDKPIGCTSMDVVRVVRRAAGKTKTGHAGTLDPLAGGLLICCLGRATSAVEHLMGLGKQYITTVDLSAFTATDDAEGTPEPIPVTSPPDREQVRKALSQLTGEIQQVPPAYSAMKVGGRRAYHLARKGQSVELPPRTVRIDSIDLLSYDWPHVELHIDCGRGTYIRSLARQIGELLGTGGYLTALRRTAIGPYHVDNATPLDDLPQPLPERLLLPTP
jgi:tRNA pseudouridine55 synthase